MWDCRSDASALFFEYGVRISCVIDLQLHYVASKILSGANMQWLCGLGKVLDRDEFKSIMAPAERSRLSIVKQNAHKLFAPQLGGSYAVWLERPLQTMLLEYATDCVYFPKLRRALNRNCGVWFAGIEEIFGNLLVDAAKARVDDAIAGNHDGSDRDRSIRVDPKFTTQVRRYLEENPARDRVPRRQHEVKSNCTTSKISTAPGDSGVAPTDRVLLSTNLSKVCAADQHQMKTIARSNETLVTSVNCNKNEHDSQEHHSHAERKLVMLKKKNAKIVVNLLKPYFKHSLIKSELQFKSLARSITKTLTQLFGILDSIPEDEVIYREAVGLVRSTMCDLDPMSVFQFHDIHEPQSTLQ